MEMGRSENFEDPRETESNPKQGRRQDDLMERRESVPESRLALRRVDGTDPTEVLASSGRSGVGGEECCEDHSSCEIPASKPSVTGGCDGMGLRTPARGLHESPGSVFSGWHRRHFRDVEL
jgi:hypothetical protein